MDPRVIIKRNPDQGRHPFQEVFMGFENVSAIRSIFGSETDKILSGLAVDIQDTGAYLHVDDENGIIVVDANYLKRAKEVYLYLDVVHELVHIKQLNDGRDLFDSRFSYVDRPTELEAYRETVSEARRIGLAEQEIVEYLQVEWVVEDDFRRLLSSLGIKR